jgi:hypothetical protein
VIRTAKGREPLLCSGGESVHFVGEFAQRVDVKPDTYQRL